MALMLGAGCGAVSSPALLHNSGEGVPHVAGDPHKINLALPRPIGLRSAIELEPYVCSVAGPVQIDRVSLIDPTDDIRLDRWGFYNGINGTLFGETDTLEGAHATSHSVRVPCGAKWRRIAVLYVEVHRAGIAPAAFYGVQLHYRSFGRSKKLTLDIGVEICAQPRLSSSCPDPHSDSAP